MTTEAPEARPVKKPMRRFIIVLVPPPTAARASLPRNCPTITASTVLYNCWKKVQNRMGKKKYRIPFQTGPSRMVFPFLISFIADDYSEDVKK